MENQLPIEHLSFSALKEYCKNRWLFKKHYILNDWNGVKTSPSMLAGKGFHKAMESYLSGMQIEAAIQKGIQETEAVSDKKIEWGKEGSREKIIKDMTQGFNFYINELPVFGKIISTEQSITTDFTVNGKLSPLPLKAVIDVVTDINGELHLHDHKLVSSFSDIEKEKANYIIQGMFNYFTVKEKYQREPVAIHFHEVKKSKNRDGQPQVQTYTIEFNKHPEYLKYFDQLYTGFIYEVSSDSVQYLPNFDDLLGGEESWKDFTSEVMDFNPPVQVSHKASYMVNVDEVKFVPSAVETTPQGKIISKLQEFGMPLEFEKEYKGANATLYTFKPARGVSMAKLASYEDDVALALESRSVRIQAPIKGTGFIGVEASAIEQQTIDFKDEFLKPGTLNLPVGRDVYGNDVTINLEKAPHLLVAGQTGSGKSVFLATVISAITKQMSEAELDLILIDPKKNEFTAYDSLPHLNGDILTETTDIATAIEWLCDEMDNRYSRMKEARVRNINEYNQTAGQMKKTVVIIDELSDLLHSESGKIVEKGIIRLAQKARAAGIHLIAATQRPSVDVVTGLMKANFPTRISFRTASSVDSTVILDQTGAEKLIGNGDMLLLDPKQQNLIRLQGYYI